MESQAASPIAAENAVDTSERFGLLGNLIAKHRMRQAIKHGLVPFPPGLGGFGSFGYPG